MCNMIGTPAGRAIKRRTERRASRIRLGDMVERRQWDCLEFFGRTADEEIVDDPNAWIRGS
jgi:hypothetical protein